MSLEDITATGGHNLKGVRNPDLYQGPPPTFEQMKAQTDRVEAGYNSGRIGYDDTLAPGWDSPVPMPELGDFGASKYDTDLIVNPQGQGDVIDQRAANQSAWAKWGAAIPQAITTAGTTFMQGTVGLFYGAGSAIANGEFNKLWNNDFTEAMDSINRAVQEIAPIYQSQDEQQNPLSNLLSAGPLAQNMGQLVGFIAGAAYSGSAYMKAFEFLGRGVDALRAGKGAFKAVSSLAKASKNNMATQAAASILGANGEATIEAFGNTKDWRELETMKLQDYYQANQGALLEEAANIALQEVNPEDYPSREEYVQAVRMKSAEIMDATFNKRLTDIENASIKMGNVIWAENMALLGFTHYKTLGRIYSGGYRANKTLANFVRRATNEAGQTTLEATKKGTVRNIAESLGKAAYEGVEEMSQSAFSKGAGYWTEKDIFEPLREKRNERGEAETFNILTGLAEGMKDQLADPNNWVEFIMGMGAGMLPIPMPHRNAKGKISLLKTPEMVNTFRENSEMNSLAEETVGRINKMMEDPKYQTLANALIVDAVKENKKKGSLGDQFAYKTEDFSQLVNLVTALEQVDQVDIFQDEVQSVLDMEETDENGQVILEGLSKEGAVPEYLQNKSNAEIVREYKDKASQLKEDIGRIVTNSENIRATYGDSLSEDALSSLVTLKSQLDNWDRRYKEVGKTIPEYIKAYPVDQNDKNLSTLLNSLKGNGALSFVDENLDELYKRTRAFVSQASKGQYLEDTNTKKITDDLVDMYRMGISMRNGIISFNSITFNPESFNQKVEKETKKENKKKEKENVKNLKSRYDKVQTIKDLQNLEASSDPIEFGALMNDLEKSRDSKLVDLNKKRSVLGSVLSNLRDSDIPVELADALEDTVENIVDNTPADALLGEEGSSPFIVPISNTLSRLLSANAFGLTPEQIQALPEQVNQTITDALTKSKEARSKVPNVAPSVKVEEDDIILEDGTVLNSQTEDDGLDEDLKESEDMLSPKNPKSDNPTVEPALAEVAPELDNSREKVDRVSGYVTEVNYHALKNGELITPANLVEWNEYARKNRLTEVDPAFTSIYNYLVDKGAYNYLNKGELKVNDRVYAFRDNSFGDTVFFGKPLKDIADIKSINDIQPLMAASKSYDLGTKTVQSEDGLLTIGAKGFSVAQIFNGKFRYSEEAPLTMENISKLFPEGVKKEWTIGVISNNGQIYSRVPLSEDMIAHDSPFTANHDGRVYLFVKGPNGRYMPQSLRVVPFSGMLTGKIGEAIGNALHTMALARNENEGNKNHPYLNAGIQELSKYIYTGNMIAAITRFPVEGVPTKHIALLKKDKAGKVIQKEYIPLQESTYAGTPLSPESIMDGLRNALVNFGATYQVGKNSLKNDSKYQQFLIDAGVLTSNLIFSPVMETNFVLTDRVYDSGTTVSTPQPAPANPSTVTEEQTSTPQPAVVSKKVPEGSKPFDIELFREALDKAPQEIRDMIAPLNMKNRKVERQLMLATALLVDPSVLEQFGGLEKAVVSILSAKLDVLRNIFNRVGFSKKLISEENMPIYSRIRNALTSDPLTLELQRKESERLNKAKSETVQGENKIQKGLEVTNNLLTFAELSQEQRDALSKMAITEEEFNNWSKEEQDKAIECYS